MTDLGPILRMAQACTREQAQAQARVLLASGADPRKVADLLVEFDELHDCQVQQVTA